VGFAKKKKKRVKATLKKVSDVFAWTFCLILVRLVELIQQEPGIISDPMAFWTQPANRNVLEYHEVSLPATLKGALN
jgi:hypothetical protein